MSDHHEIFTHFFLHPDVIFNSHTMLINANQVTNFHNRSTEPLNYRIYARPESIKQAR